jgi:hypothetical protein
MPRPRKPARAFRAPKSRKWTRAEAIEEMARPTVTNEFDMVHPKTHPLLAGFPADMHEDMIDEAEAIYYADRHKQGEQTARQYLREWRPFMWDQLFNEFPNLEQELTPVQREQWEAAKVKAAEQRAADAARVKTQPAPVEFPPPKDDPNSIQ